MNSWTFKQIAPPGARGKFTPDLYTDQNFYAEEKVDGDRRIAQFCNTPESWASPVEVRFTGRRVSDIDGLLVEKTECLPHLNGRQDPRVEATVQHQAPGSLIGTVLDGEMIVDKPGARSKDVTSIIGSKPDLAIQKQQERGWLVYVVFDCLFYQGEDLRKMPLVRRRRYLRKAIDEWNNPYVRMVENTTLRGQTPEEMVLDIWKRGGEGIILKDLGSEYGDEKAWVKVKKEFTEDVVIIGYDDPEKETEKTESYTDENGVKKKRVLEVSESRLAKNGWIGAVRFGQYVRVGLVAIPNEVEPRVEDGFVLRRDRDGCLWELTYCGSCSGMDDAVRAELSENKVRNLGRVVEILANEREPTGKFRHPRMVQFRDNKNASDCIWGQK